MCVRFLLAGMAIAHGLLASAPPPPLDAHGNVTPHNHPEIQDDDGVLRRISAEHVVPGAVPGSLRLSSIAFRGSSDANGGMSVDLEALIIGAGIDPRVHVTTPKYMGSVRFEAHQLRAESLMVGYDPIPGNHFHGEVWGTFTRACQRRIQNAATWFVPLPGVSIT